MPDTLTQIAEAAWLARVKASALPGTLTGAKIVWGRSLELLSEPSAADFPRVIYSARGEDPEYGDLGRVPIVVDLFEWDGKAGEHDLATLDAVDAWAVGLFFRQRWKDAAGNVIQCWDAQGTPVIGAAGGLLQRRRRFMFEVN